MTTGPGRDPAVLDADRIVLFQYLSMVPDPEGWVEALGRNPSFRLRRLGEGTIADWIQFTPERDPVRFPLGRALIGGHGVLLESLVEERLDTLRFRAEEAAGRQLSRDQIRVFPLAEAFASPHRLLQPLQEADGDRLTRRDLAELYVTLAWVWIAHPALDGRTPEAVLRETGGAERVEPLLDGLAEDLQARIPRFPALAAEDVREMLESVPAPAAPQPAAPPAGRSAPAKRVP